MSKQSLTENFEAALYKRRDFIAGMEKEQTDCYRLFHGISEGYPGLSIDRYGDQIIIQSFRDEKIEEESVRELFEKAEEFFNRSFNCYYNHRKGRYADTIVDKTREESSKYCMERGIKFVTEGDHGGLDPLLFLDLRSGRKFLQENCRDKSVLNLFSYTCTAGIVAVAGGAREVWNVDFSRKWLSYGKSNLDLNGYDHRDMKLIREDFFPAVRQLSGLGMSGRARKIKYIKLMPKKFDIVFLDPPTYTKSKFFSVDIVNDYQSLFKPSLMALNKGGTIICTNHSPAVEQDQWVELLKACGEKAGMPLKSVKILKPGEDFPSFDGKDPLKIAVCSTQE